MLVLSRRKGEEVLIPQYGIVITLVEARNGRARLGFRAPGDLKIIRRELHEQLAPAGADGPSFDRSLALKAIEH